MKAFACAILLLCLAINAEAQTAPSAPRNQPMAAPRASASPTPTAPDLTLKSGAVYHEAVITSTDPAYATIRYRGGMGRIDLADLPDDLRRKVAPGYDPQKAAAFRAVDDQSTEQSNQAMQAEMARLQAEKDRAEQLRVAIANADTIYGKVLSVVPGQGVLVIGQMVGHYEENWVCLLRGYQQAGVDGDIVPTLKVIPDGAYRYETASGATATVRAFRFVGVATVAPHKERY